MYKTPQIQSLQGGARYSQRKSPIVQFHENIGLYEIIPKSFTLKPTVRGLFRNKFYLHITF